MELLFQSYVVTEMTGLTKKTLIAIGSQDTKLELHESDI